MSPKKVEIIGVPGEDITVPDKVHLQEGESYTPDQVGQAIGAMATGDFRLSIKDEMPGPDLD
jgi:hypothetical protein